MPQVPTLARQSRAVRLVAQGAVLALVAGGTSAFAALHKSVDVDVDGRTVHVTGFGRTVADVLSAADVSVGERDLVVPSLRTRARDGGEIVVRHGRQIALEIDGTPRTVWTTALTVGDAVDALGVRTQDAVLSASRSAPVERAGVVRVSTQKTVSVAVDGQLVDVDTTGATVRDALLEVGLILEPGDTLSVPLDDPAVDGLVVRVSRAVSTSGTATQTIAFKERTIEDPTLARGTRQVVSSGRLGLRVVTFAASKVRGVVVDRTIIASVVTREPEDRVVRVGTQVIPDVPDVKPGTSQAIARELLADRGMGDDQFACLVTLWNHESGWRINAENKSSGAYGIPQALPGTKMASIASDWRTNPRTQIIWGLGYIKNRYGTPCGAWAKFQSQGWY